MISYDAAFALFCALGTLVLACHVWYLQMEEIFERNFMGDEYSRLRYIFLVLNSISIVTMAPVVVFYSWLLLEVPIPGWLQFITRVCGRLGPLGVYICLFMVYRYRIKS